MQITSIYSYIIHNLVNEEAAYRLESTINKKVEKISFFPENYSLVSALLNDVSAEFKEVRKATVGNYVLIYRYYETLEIALITHIFHQTQDYGRLFQN